MPLFESRDSRDARARVAEIQHSLVGELVDLGNRLQDVRFRVDRIVKGQLAEGDVADVENTLQSAEANLDTCRRALPVLEHFASNGRLDPGEFHALKPRLVEEDEAPTDIEFTEPWEAALWMADRVQEFADYLGDTQLPWLEKGVQEVQEGGDTADDRVKEAESKKQEAEQAFDDFSRHCPDIHLAHAVNLKRDLDDSWDRLQQCLQDRVHTEIAASAQDVVELSEDLANAVSEAEAFRHDPASKALEGRDFLDGLREAFRHAGLALPAEAGEAGQALEEAVAETKKTAPDWNLAVASYIRASNLAAEAADRLPESAR